MACWRLASSSCTWACTVAPASSPSPSPRRALGERCTSGVSGRPRSANWRSSFPMVASRSCTARPKRANSAPWRSASCSKLAFTAMSCPLVAAATFPSSSRSATAAAKPLDSRRASSSSACSSLAASCRRSISDPSSSSFCLKFCCTSLNFLPLSSALFSRAWRFASLSLSIAPSSASSESFSRRTPRNSATMASSPLASVNLSCRPCFPSRAASASSRLCWSSAISSCKEASTSRNLPWRISQASSVVASASSSALSTASFTRRSTSFS
mmetsp:Transcript_10531/g.29517  ORF Transcript_10531/g.29517 Transcript_10531/m.29517 type:complete len:270 (-) Transcript_10531:1304-2113(-)